MSQYVCTICGFIYDEEKGIPSANINPGTKWEELPSDWSCPLCGAPKDAFVLKEEPKEKKNTAKKEKRKETEESFKELSSSQVSALCSNLAKGCEKQYLLEEAGLFSKLSDYYKENITAESSEDFSSLMNLINDDLNNEYDEAFEVANNLADRASKRALVWSQKVTKMLSSILAMYEKKKDQLLDNTNIYVCEICGFIYIGAEAPLICPVCKVPRSKIKKIEREAS